MLQCGSYGISLPPEGLPGAGAQALTLVRDTAMASFRMWPTSDLTMRCTNWCGTQKTRTFASLRGTQEGGKGREVAAASTRSCSHPASFLLLPLRPRPLHRLAAPSLHEQPRFPNAHFLHRPPAHLAASTRSGHATTLGGSSTPEKYFTFSWRSLMSSVSFLHALRVATKYEAGERGACRVIHAAHGDDERDRGAWRAVQLQAALMCCINACPAQQPTHREPPPSTCTSSS